MDEPETFSSLILSVPRSDRRRAFKRDLAIGLALALHALVLAALLIAPFLVLEMIAAPKAGVLPPIHFTPPRPASPTHGGDGLPAPLLHKGDGGGRQRQERPIAPTTTLDRPLAAPSPLTPPDPSSAPDQPPSEASDRPEGGELTDDPGDWSGSDVGVGNRPGDCPGCPGKGVERGPGPPGGDDPVYAWTPGVTPPELIPGSRALPKYPDLARRARVEGSVILMIRIDEKGLVGEVQVIRSVDQRWGFDLAAIEAVKQWRYRPASMHGRAVSVWGQVIMEFSLSR